MFLLTALINREKKNLPWAMNQIQIKNPTFQFIEHLNQSESENNDREVLSRLGPTRPPFSSLSSRPLARRTLPLWSRRGTVFFSPKNKTFSPQNCIQFIKINIIQRNRHGTLYFRYVGVVILLTFVENSFILCVIESKQMVCYFLLQLRLLINRAYVLSSKPAMFRTEKKV